MKTSLCIIFAFAVVALHAADLQLADGRTLRDFRIVSQTPTTVMVRHSDGAAKVEKALLPEELFKVYPVDEVAAKTEAEEIARGREAYETQRRAQEEKRAKEHEAFLEGVRKRNAADEARLTERRAASAEAAAVRATRTPATERKSKLIRTETRFNTPRSIVSETVTVDLPPASKRGTYTVDYEIVGGALALEVRSGEGAQHHQVNNVNATAGWSRRVLSKTGERLYLSAQSGGAGGDEFRVRIRVDGTVVREAAASGTNVQAEVSYALP